jgi:hypothetical protein
MIKATPPTPEDWVRTEAFVGELPAWVDAEGVVAGFKKKEHIPAGGRPDVEDLRSLGKGRGKPQLDPAPGSCISLGQGPGVVFVILLRFVVEKRLFHVGNSAFMFFSRDNTHSIYRHVKRKRSFLYQVL